MSCVKTCGCSSTKNFGVKDSAEFKAVRKILFTKYNASDGTVNKLDLNVTWDQAFWNALKANADFTKRLQPVKIDEWNPNVEDAVTVTRPSGKVVKVRDGVTSFELFIDGESKTLKSAMDSFFCGNVGAYFIDSCNSLGGIKCGSDFKPFLLADDTFDVQPIYNNDSDIERLRVRFSLDLSQLNTFDVVSSASMEYNPSLLEPLYDGEAYGATTTNTTTQTVVQLSPSTNKAKEFVALQGATTPANWTITDSTGATSAPSGVTESPVGTYTIDYTTIATGLATFYYLDEVYEISFNTTIA